MYMRIIKEYIHITYTVYCTVFTIQCILYSIKCALYTVQCTIVYKRVLVVQCQSGTDFVFGFLESRLVTGIPVSKLYITSLHLNNTISVAIRCVGEHCTRVHYIIRNVFPRRKDMCMQVYLYLRNTLCIIHYY